MRSAKFRFLLYILPAEYLLRLSTARCVAQHFMVFFSLLLFFFFLSISVAHSEILYFTEWLFHREGFGCIRLSPTKKKKKNYVPIKHSPLQLDTFCKIAFLTFPTLQTLKNLLYRIIRAVYDEIIRVDTRDSTFLHSGSSGIFYFLFSY